MTLSARESDYTIDYHQALATQLYEVTSLTAQVAGPISYTGTQMHRFGRNFQHFTGFVFYLFF